MIYDITPTLSERSQVWRERPPFKKQLLTDMHRGSFCTTYALSFPSHIGATAVAPLYFRMKGESIDKLSLDYFVGCCQVIHVEVRPGSLIREAMLPVDIHAERVLFRTNTFDPKKGFQENFAALDPTLIDELGKKGVMLVGIDTPSIDLYADHSLSAHRRTQDYSMAILTGLTLEGVPDGIYELMALPLKLEGCDASPVRAVLRS